MDEQTKRIADDLIVQVRTIFESEGQLQPARAFFLAEGGDVVVVLLPFKSEAEKDAAGHLLRSLAVEHKAKLMLYVAEAWHTKVEAPKGAAVMYQPPMQSPQRVETMMFVVEWPGHAAMGHAEILREGRQWPTFAYPAMREDTIDTFKGRFIGVLPMNQAIAGTHPGLKALKYPKGGR